MRDSRPPEREARDHEPHAGRAARLRHELEEAVERVPRPVRWTVGKLVGLILLALGALVVVLLLTAVLYVANRTEWAARELALVANQALVSRSDVTLEIADLKGNPLAGVRVLGPRLRFRDGDLPPLLEADEVRLRYPAWALLTGGRGPIVVEIERPVVRLGRGPDGKLRLPVWKAPPPRGEPRARDIVLRVRQGSLLMPDTSGHIAGLDLEAMATTGRPVRLEVRSLRWTRGPFGSVLERCVASYQAGDSARLDVRELRTRDLALRGRATWAPGSREALVRMEADRIRWRWLARVTQRDDFDVPGEGRMEVEARTGESPSGRFAGAGVWNDLAAEVRGGFAWRNGRLRVEPLTGSSPAGDLEGAVTWSRQGYEIDARVRRGNPARWSVIGIQDWPAGDLNGHFRYAVDGGGVKRARLTASLGPSTWTGWRADSGTVEVNFADAGPDSFQVRVRRRGGEMTLRALTDTTGWSGEYALARFPLEEWPDGRASGLKGTLASGRGTADSRDGVLRVTGTLDGTETDWLGIQAARWRMSEMRGVLLPKPDLAAALRLDDLFFLSVHWDSVAVPLHLGEGTVELAPLRAMAGDTVLTFAGRAAWDRHGWRLTGDSAAVRSRQFAWTAEPPVELAGDPRGVDFERLKARDGPARLAIEGRWAAPGGVYDWTARVEQLELSRLGLPEAWELAGAADAQLRVTGLSGDPSWELTARARAPGVRGHRADSLQLALGGSPGRLELREVRAMLDGGVLRVRGEVTGAARAWPDTLTGPGITRWIAEARHWTGLVRAERLPLDRLERLAPAARRWTGRVSGTLELAGRPGDPELTWSVEGRPLAWADYRVDELVARGRYRGGRLEVPELRMTRGGVVSTVSGAMPLWLALGERPRVDESPMEWQINLPNGDLALLPPFVPQIGSATGRFDLTARLGGSARHPDLAGRARVREGRVRLAGREEVLEAVHADFTFDESRVTLDSLSARQRKRVGAPGLVRGAGVVNLKGLALSDYRFALQLHNFTALEPGVYEALFDGNFRVTNGPRMGGVTLPLVEGDIELRRATVVFDFANQSQVEQVAAATQRLYWLYRVQLNATDNLHWRPSAADIEFSADLRLEQTPDSLIIYGDMSALRGNYYYLSNRFRMDRVDLSFDNVGGVNPKLDLVGVTRVPKSACQQGYTLGPGAERGQEEITVTITGRGAEPVMSFASSPDDWDQPCILQALTYGRGLDERGQLGLRATGASLADDWVTRNLNRQLSAELSTLFQGYLSEWALERESGGLFGGEGELIIGTRTQLTPELSVGYRQRLPGFARQGGSTTTSSTTPSTNPLERDVEAEYRINRFFYITSQLTQRRPLSTTGGTVTTSPEFNVNLKARWEY